LEKRVEIRFLPLATQGSPRLTHPIKAIPRCGVSQ
jgi:hypothetical protein